MTFQDLRNDGFTVMKHENINIMATEFHIQKKMASRWKGEKKMDKNSWTYKFGYALGRVVTLCAVVAIVALTCRFIMWLF